MEIGHRFPGLNKSLGTRQSELIARTMDGRPIVASIDDAGRVRAAYIVEESSLPVDNQ
jgi:hypothetical protein